MSRRSLLASFSDSRLSFSYSLILRPAIAPALPAAVANGTASPNAAIISNAAAALARDSACGPSSDALATFSANSTDRSGPRNFSSLAKPFSSAPRRSSSVIRAFEGSIARNAATSSTGALTSLPLANATIPPPRIAGASSGASPTAVSANIAAGIGAAAIPESAVLSAAIISSLIVVWGMDSAKIPELRMRAFRFFCSCTSASVVASPAPWAT